MKAYCFASGLIEFGRSVPRGALLIASGPKENLHDFIAVMARHGYRTHKVDGRRTKIPGSDILLVPGIPEAPNQHEALDALARFALWLRQHAPDGVVVNVGANALAIARAS